jgi:hypothetical protein
MIEEESMEHLNGTFHSFKKVASERPGPWNDIAAGSDPLEETGRRRSTTADKDTAPELLIISEKAVELGQRQ